ncbi:SPFH domain-containing protein [Bryobacter aggregatus]|uniref:SPFH domain-containing protein n=1 Tax=Bryobacter aggregatus TaxID=360054 RepID=UPI000563AA3C|nr:SPFH domain-containing protein [Bryobacter aggregatus]
MSILDNLKNFAVKQFIDVIQYVEPEDGILSYRYPMQDMEIQTGAKLTVRESQMAAFVNEGQVADIFGPGLYTLNTQTIPILTNLKNWDKMFASPFKSDVYFFSTRTQPNQRWGTSQPVTIRDKDFGMVRLRAFGIYSWHVSDPRTFHSKVSGTRDIYRLAEIEGQLRNNIIANISNAFASSGVPFLDMAANQIEVGKAMAATLQPEFAALGLTLDTLIVENLSLPEELQKLLDERIGMNMIGNMGQYTQYKTAQSIPIAAANEGGLAGIGASLTAGMGMASQMAGAFNQAMQPQAPPPQAPPPPAAPVVAAAAGIAAAVGGDTKFCMNCGSKIPRAAKFCGECGTKQPEA